MSSNWNTAGNWGPGCTGAGGIPGSADTVDIPSGPPNDPSISGSITLQGLTVYGTLSLSANATLDTPLVNWGTVAFGDSNSHLHRQQLHRLWRGQWHGRIAHLRHG